MFGLAKTGPYRAQFLVESVRDLRRSLREAGGDPGTIPTPAGVGIEKRAPDDRAAIGFAGGESAGLRRLAEYVWEGDHLREYKETRNGLLGADYSSKFSA